MNRLPSADLAAFLQLVDAELRSKGRILVIGGAAIALAYGGARFLTSDIDVASSIGEDLREAVDAATQKSKRPVPMRFTEIVIAPYDFESRVVRILGDLGKLEVYVPERHDLAIMKMARGTEHDLAGIEEIHGGETPLSRATILERFEETLPFYTGTPNDFKWALFSVLERLFPEDDYTPVRTRIEKLVKARMKRLGIK